MTDTVKIKLSDVGERIWLLESMGGSISSKRLFMACEKIAPIIAPSEEDIKRADVKITQNGPVWDSSIDTSLEVELPLIILEGIKTAVFGPVPATDRSVKMVNKLNLWTVHD